MNVIGHVSASIILSASLPVAVFSQEKINEAIPTLNFNVQFNDDGSVSLSPNETSSMATGETELLGEPDMRVDQGGASMHVSAFDQILNSIGTGEYSDYVVTGEDGQTAVITVPSNASPANWTNPNNTFGISRVDANFRSLGISQEAQKQAQEYLRLMARAAYDEYCGTNVRPSEFTVEVTVGASFIVNGSAKVSAKFISADMCKS
ncbi:hypothetical protein [Sagittula salina]|uniref:Uncharacterized protein n=1 Tax=Sagittula salina TaxID=2820268 RepID=A0A940MM27_9RHOB|nr:hypothetical protein [Sagittula salina]MBP0481222.1 hypothetical protein [Sagittula salina]